MAILLLDNFDSFTYNLVHYIEQLGERCEVVRNDVSLAFIKQRNFAGIVLSPGPETPYKAGCMMEVIDYYHDKKPILGVCLGHQAIGQYFGYDLVTATAPKHGKITSIVLNDQEQIFNTLPKKINVVQYNSLLLKSTETLHLKVIATDDDKNIMAIRHNKLPIYGFQFHPEAALTEYGMQMIKNWLFLAGLNI